MTLKPITVVFMGTPDFAVPPLKSLLSDPGFKILAVVTQPDKPSGRKMLLTKPPVKITAEEAGIPVLQPLKVKNNPEFLETFRNLNPDIAVTAAYGHILPSELLNIPKFGFINIHASLLPSYRGASPIEEALLKGDSKTGITYIQMNEKMDEGDIISIHTLPISDTDTSIELTDKLSLLAAKTIASVLTALINGELQPKAQEHEKATYCSKIDKKDGLITPLQQTSEQILNMIRAFTPWPSAYLSFKGKNIKILGAEKTTPTPNTEPSRLPKVGGSPLTDLDNPFLTMDGNLYLKTSNGLIKINKLQLEGKSTMLAQDFLRGHANFFNTSEQSEISRNKSTNP